MVVRGPLLFLSVGNGNAWMLDLDDPFALWLLRDGEEQPLPLVETDRNDQVDWPLHYELKGDQLPLTDRAGAVTVVEWGGFRDVRALIRRYHPRAGRS